MTSKKTLDDMTADSEEYYCANAVEKLFQCNRILLYTKRGGFGRNYRYCDNCYTLWWKMKDKEKKENPIKKCLIGINKL